MLIRDGEKGRWGTERGGGGGWGGGIKYVNMVLNVHRNHKAY